MVLWTTTVYSWIDGTVELEHCTLSDNTANDGAAGIDGDGSEATTLSRSIVAYSQLGAACSADGTFVDAGYNIVDDGTCISAPTSMATDPQLGPLQDNGGPTATHEPAPLSPAVDAIRLADCTLSTDGRGVPRPQGAGACDIGAVEYVDAIPTASTAGVLVLAALLIVGGAGLIRRRI